MECGYGKDGSVHGQLGEDVFDSDETLDGEEDGVGEDGSSKSHGKEDGVGEDGSSKSRGKEDAVGDGNNDVVHDRLHEEDTCEGEGEDTGLPYSWLCSYNQEEEKLGMSGVWSDTNLEQFAEDLDMADNLVRELENHEAAKYLEYLEMLEDAEISYYAKIAEEDDDLMCEGESTGQKRGANDMVEVVDDLSVGEEEECIAAPGSFKKKKLNLPARVHDEEETKRLGAMLLNFMNPSTFAEDGSIIPPIEK